MTLLGSLIWTTVSIGWLLTSLGLGLLYAFFFYRHQNDFRARTKYILGTFRMLTVTFILLLMFSPLLKTVSTYPKKPLILIAQDNSSSISLFKSEGFRAAELLRQLGELKKSLGSDYDVREFHFDKELYENLSGRFDGKQTDISSALQELTDRFSNENIGGIVLASDGIYNKGSSPQYIARNLKTSIYTIALGDTVPKRDLLIGNINYNKTAFLGNDFEVEVLLKAYQCNNSTIHLNVSEDGHLITSKALEVGTAEFHKVVTLKLNADKKGIHKFSFNLQPISNEISTSNNIETIFVEVLDNKKKILLLYDGPHPDVSAIKSSLESNRNYQVKASMIRDLDAAQLNNYSLVILYQLPGSESSLPLSMINQLTKLKLPLWYVIGAQSDIKQFNRLQNVLQINASRQDMQDVFTKSRDDFSAFKLSDSTRKTLQTLPPLMAPFGKYDSPSAQSVLLTQKVGNIETAVPLLTFAEDAGVRMAILSAEGIWKWRLAEFEAKGNYSAVEELLGQTVQYLTAKGDRSRFKVYPSKHVFDESEEIILSGELYNEALELVNTPDVTIELKGKRGKRFSYLLSRNGPGYHLNTGNLPADEYTFIARSRLGNNNFSSGGQFVVKSLDIETRQSTADHQLLYQLAQETGGKTLMPSQITTLADLIRKNDDIKTVVYADEAYNELADQIWVFVLILLLLGSEWFLRKRQGKI